MIKSEMMAWDTNETKALCNALFHSIIDDFRFLYVASQWDEKRELEIKKWLKFLLIDVRGQQRVWKSQA